jgi:hypothetical protein
MIQIDRAGVLFTLAVVFGCTLSSSFSSTSIHTQYWQPLIAFFSVSLPSNVFKSVAIAADRIPTPTATTTNNFLKRLNGWIVEHDDDDAVAGAAHVPNGTSMQSGIAPTTSHRNRIGTSVLVPTRRNVLLGSGECFEESGDVVGSRGGFIP